MNIYYRFSIFQEFIKSGSWKLIFFHTNSLVNKSTHHHRYVRVYRSMNSHRYQQALHSKDLQDRTRGPLTYHRLQCKPCLRGILVSSFVEYTRMLNTRSSRMYVEWKSECSCRLYCPFTYTSATNISAWNIGELRNTGTVHQVHSPTRCYKASVLQS